MAIQVKDNYLDKDSFKTIKETISSDMFPWFYNDKKVYHTGKDSLFDYQFTHLFYQDFKIIFKSAALLSRTSHYYKY